MRSRISLVLALSLAGACGDSTPAGSDGAPGEIDADVIDAAPPDADPWAEPDPLGRTTPGNLIAADPEEVIVTSVDLAAAWQPYAEARTLSGVLARVVTMDEIKGATPAGVDDAATLRAYLYDRYLAGTMRYALLGGDGEVVPYRRVWGDIYVPTGDEYTANGPAEDYFADLDDDWDLDGDGAYGEQGDDLSLEQVRATEIAVGLVPVSHVEEIANYAAKVAVYESGEGGRATYPLLLSDIATTFLGIDIDAAEGIEPTIADTFPSQFLANAHRIYATQGAVDSYGGELFSATAVDSAFDAGYALVFHSGHGGFNWFTDNLGKVFVLSLGNTLPSIFFTTACEAGNFADRAIADDASTWPVQGPDGGVGYLGNTAVGLGPIGGSQLLYATFQGLFGGHARLGDAVNYGRAHMREVSLSMDYIPTVVTDDSEYWTQMIAVLLGDPALPVWTADPVPFALAAPASYSPGYQDLTVTVTSGGLPVTGATVTLLKSGDFVLRATSDGVGQATFSFMPIGRASLEVAAAFPGAITAHVEIPPNP